MLNASVIEGTNVVSLTAEGSISTEEEILAQETISEVADEHGSAQLLLDYADIDVGRVEPKAMWEDIKGTRLLDEIDRVAVVADSSILSRFLEVVGSVSGLEASTFENRDDAVAWLTGH